jgi:cellulose biosynthesis protein BcsQ
MDINDNQDALWPDPEEELANDVALLYSWAKVGETTYRDFSRQRRRSPVKTEPPEVVQVPESPGSASVLAVYSIAGGVGKSTLCANLSKTLSALGEQILLVDGSHRGFLPFHFGATEQRKGVRSFRAPGASGRSVDIVTAEQATSEWLAAEVKNASCSSQRVIIDLEPSCEAMLAAVLPLCSLILIPLMPDLNSILTIPHLQRMLKPDSGAPRTPAAFYILNCFDPLSANDRRVRELVAQECESQLLPVALRHSRELREALHAGIAAADHTPGVELGYDYLELALWVRRVAPLGAAGIPVGRWSEQ